MRDLGAWMVRLLEDGARGAFDATGPTAAGARCDWPTLVEACRRSAQAHGLAPAEPVWIDEAFLSAEGVQPWSELPLWLPSSDSSLHGFSRVDVSRAGAAGLVTRPLAETIDAVLAEGSPAADDPRRAGKLSKAREAELIARWRSMR